MEDTSKLSKIAYSEMLMKKLQQKNRSSSFDGVNVLDRPDRLTDIAP